MPSVLGAEFEFAFVDARTMKNDACRIPMAGPARVAMPCSGYLASQVFSWFWILLATSSWYFPVFLLTLNCPPITLIL